MFPAFIRFVNRQRWLDSVGNPLQRGVNAFYRGMGRPGKFLQNFLNGVWLGHPLHPLMTDVPVGAWTVTVVLETVAWVTNNGFYGRAADVTLAVGLAAALGAAVTGTTDWKDTLGDERKVGLLHGLLMLTTTVIFVVALILGIGAARVPASVVSYVGYVFLAVGAYLGGHEVFGIGYSVNHTAFEHGPGEYVPVMSAAELPAETPTRAAASGVPILLVTINSQVYALSDTCAHAGCSLATGTLVNNRIQCPCHGSQFNLRDGSVRNGPATFPQPSYDVRVEDGMIEVRVR